MNKNLESQKSDVKESPLFWPVKMKKSYMLVLDETLIPTELRYIKVRNTHEAVDVIRDMKTRAFGQFLVVLYTFLLDLNKAKGKLTDEQLLKKLKETSKALCSSRPTFPFSEVTSIIINWAEIALSSQKEMAPFVTKNIMGYAVGIRAKRMQRVQNIADLIQDGDRILTHCNVSGELAMATYIARENGRSVKVFATETRPYFQGAKLTMWEMKKMKTPATLIADNAVGSVMADGLVNKVFVGSDRSCANGDFANKIGTYQIAVLAKEFGVPFYVMTQPSNKVKKGDDMPIEMRSGEEVIRFKGKKIIRGNVQGFYPGFDMVPHTLVTATIPIEVR